MKYDLDTLIALNMAGIGTEKMSQMGKAALKNAVSSCDIEKERRLIKEHDVDVISLYDERYPEKLKNIYSPPIVLYIKGAFASEDAVSVAIVGSRRASRYGIDTARRLGEELASRGITVASGLARGIDSAAHTGALKAAGRTIAVLGSGLAALYPPENAKLADAISNSGAVISEFPMTMGPLRHNFPRRNRIISGLSLGVVIVEAAVRSGALITASFALEQGREVFAVPGKAGSTTSKGTHNLIKEGARLAETADDIIEELNLVLPPAGASRQRASRGAGLKGKEKMIYDTLSDEPEHIDEIIDKTDLPAGEVTRLLLALETKKMVKQLPGRNFTTLN